MNQRSNISLTPRQREELQVQLRRRNLPVGVARRMKIILMLDEGASYSDIRQKLEITTPTISLWKKRFLSEGLPGLASFHPGRPPQKLTAQLRKEILTKTQEPPPDGSPRWSLRSMAAVIGVGKDLVRRVWCEAESKSRRPARSLSARERDRLW